MFCFLQVFCSLFSGALIALAIPNEFLKLGNPLIGMFALVPFYFAVSNSKSYKRIFWLSFIHGAFTHLLSSFWLGNFHGLAAFTLGASDIGTGFVEAFVSLFLAYPFVKKQVVQNSKIASYSIPLKIFWFAGIYTVYEWCKSTGFLAYPWGTLSMTAFKWPLIMQIADITGPYGVTFIFALFSAVLGEGINLIKEIPLAKDFPFRAEAYFFTTHTLTAILIVTMCYGAFEYVKPRKVIKTMNTVLVQQNLDTYNSNEEEGIEISQKLTEQGIKEFTNQALDTDLVVWSEGILAKSFSGAQGYYERFPRAKPLIPFIKKQKVPFIIGGSTVIDVDKHQYGNSALLFDKRGIYKGSYIKLHLVPFAESIPFVEYEAVRKLVRKIAGFSYGWIGGKKYTLFEIPIQDPNAIDTEGLQVISLASSAKPQPPLSVMVSAPICFDDAFGHVCRGLFLSGSEVFMNITNDSWSKTESAEYQHFVVAAYRAIEYRTTLARATNSGFSAVVGPSGRIIKSLPLFEEAALAVEIPVYERKMTVYAKFGNWLPLCTILLVFILIIVEKIQDIEQKEIEISVELVKRRRRTAKKTSTSKV